MAVPDAFDGRALLSLHQAGSGLSSHSHAFTEGISDMTKSTPLAPKSALSRLLRTAGQSALQGAAFKLGAGAVTLLILWAQAM
ncbi:hypothetical protein [Streptomyces sp. NPDC059389]|uniref:hypothetical protein n=1 Tax=Streptomyces sp. NPDC059389 TaxID=3346818 RepID=UPI0036BB4DAB